MGAERSPRPIGRLFEGWQLILVALGLPLTCLWLALPRPVAPELLPLPAVDRGEYARLWHSERELARAAEQTGLAFDARALGEFVRRHGRAMARGDLEHAGTIRADAQRLCADLGRQRKAAELRAIRAVQTFLFLDAVQRFRDGTRGDRELAELGGDFEKKARKSGWLDAKERLLLGDKELFALFRVRWTGFVGGLAEPALRLSLDDFRMYYRVQLEHPNGESPGEQDSFRLAVVGALGRRDPQYPEALASGVLLYRLGRAAAAADQFVAYLDAHPEGPSALRARNYALAALAESGETE